MPKSEKSYYIVGNWKMYKTIDQALLFVEAIIPEASKSSNKVMLAVPFTAIQPLAEKARGSNVMIGAQNMNDASEGAFTGEIAAVMLKDAGASFVLVGHSERRRLFGENNDFINRKIKRALQVDLQPILCIGETFEEREAGKTEEVLKAALQECLEGITKEACKSLLIAYEPVWAIGSGLAATPELANEANTLIREQVKELFGDKEGGKIAILYGGSVTADNAAGYLAASHIDGLLIGSASLQSESFAKLLLSCTSC